MYKPHNIFPFVPYFLPKELPRKMIAELICFFSKVEEARQERKE
jgi:hypothetical protein